MGPLAKVFSSAEGVKRKLIDALRNPSDAAAQYAGNEMDRIRSFADLNNRAQDEFMASGSMRGPVQNELTGVIADSYNPVGMTMYRNAPLPDAGRYAADISSLSPEAQQYFNRAVQEIVKKTGNVDFASRQYTANLAASSAPPEIAEELARFAGPTLSR